MLKYDLLVSLALVPVLAMMIFAGFVIWATPDSAELEVRKIRIADATLVGLLVLFVFTSILYFVDANGAGKEIFDKATTVIFTLIGTVIGYIFGSTKK
jgi:cytochrome bd-type quinol oxidase subunit 2